MKEILFTFISLFVAVDAVGVLPLFISLTEGLSKKERNKIILQSILTALSVALGFILLGKIIFKFLGITVADFMIAGGIILFCLAIKDISNPGKQRRISSPDLGIVPLGTPLIVGPAVLTTSLMIVSEYGIYATLISLVINILLAGLILSFSNILIKGLGKGGTKAISKVMALFLAAIAVRMIRQGIFLIWKG